MKRRSFLHVGSLSVIGMSVPLAKLSAITEQPLQISDWLTHFIQASGGRRIHRNAAPETLSPLLQNTLAFHTNEGLSTISNSAYTSSIGHTHFCFFPLQQRHAVAGLKEYRVPVFYSNDGQQWHQGATLNGYALEALCRAQLPPELLLPLGTAFANNRVAFKTKLGYWQVHTTLTGNKAETAIQVYQGDKLVFEEHFTSSHRLNTTVCI